jgi:PTH1 family peptidyl-tRNA hydrolase
MKLIVGLGNPGRIYTESRHNIGSSVVKALAKKHRIALKKNSGTFSLSGRGKIAGHDVVLAVPLTFMNLSGKAAAVLLKKYKLHLKDILIVYDDLDLELARIRIKDSGSSGGHRGLKSIIDALKTEGFARLRIGIGRPARYLDVPDYVLSSFDKADKQRLKDSLKNATECCELWIAEGITKTMNIFNRSLPAGRQGVTL